MDTGGAVLTVRSGPAVGVIAQVALLTVLGATVGLSVTGWVVGLVSGVVTNALVIRGLLRSDADRLGPADLVTLTRAILACAVAGLVADAFIGPPAVAPLVAITVVALLLDAADGWVARRTSTNSRFGARFDGEVDAFLILVLSVYVARTAGGWVLLIGAMRYAFLVAGWAVPWLRSQLPRRYWRKVVAAAQGIVLALVAAAVLPRWATYAALVGALGMLTESFGRDVWWLWRRRHAERSPRASRVGPGKHAAPAGSARRRAVLAGVANAMALMLVWFALVAPNQTYLLTPTAFLRIPVEGLVVAALALVLPPWARRAMAAVVGAALGVLTLLKLLDMGFFAALDRPFNVVTDSGYLDSTVDLVKDTLGPVGATAAVVGAVLLVVGVLVGMPLSVGRLTGLVARHRHGSLRVVTTLGVAWVVLALTGVHLGQSGPVAAASAGDLAVSQVRSIGAGIDDQQRFEAAVAVDRFRDPPRVDVLGGLRGKDVVIAFVESYGRVAIEGSPSSARVRALLDDGTRRLRAGGFSARSAFLTSPTFGGLSWLAHSTLQSGVWVDSQPRYDRLFSGNRTTLTRAFGRAGWRTVGLMPANDGGWPEGKAFYQFDKIYDGADFGYRGPKFGFSYVPDQFVLSAFQRLELSTRKRPPVMAEIDLASSHTPWAPLPRMLGWNRLGDGSVYDRMFEEVAFVEDVWTDAESIEAAYVDSIAYSLSSLISFVETYGEDDLVLVLLGDHQPATVVTGHGASRDVPITVVARDPKVMAQLAGWRWQPGMRPRDDAPVWRMDEFRDRFLGAYSPRVSSIQSRPVLRPQEAAPATSNGAATSNSARSSNGAGTSNGADRPPEQP